MVSTTIKRAGDALAAGLGLTLLAPLLGALALAIRVIDGPGVVFRHERAGQGGRTFTLLKFRTMTNASGPDGRLRPDEERLTRLGRWLRRTSLDELPQLVNVLRGEMSLVGPRPLPLAYLERYSARQARRLEVTPGITGLAQVEGRNALGWAERLELDVRYVETQSPGLDAVILLRTVGLVLSGRGVAANGHATMPEFRGEGRPSGPRAW